MSPCSWAMSRCRWQQTMASSKRPSTLSVLPRFPLALASPMRSPMVLEGRKEGGAGPRTGGTLNPAGSPGDGGKGLGGPGAHGHWDDAGQGSRGGWAQLRTTSLLGQSGGRACEDRPGGSRVGGLAEGINHAVCTCCVSASTTHWLDAETSAHQLEGKGLRAGWSEAPPPPGDLGADGVGGAPAGLKEQEGAGNTQGEGVLGRDSSGEVLEAQGERRHWEMTGGGGRERVRWG